MTTSNIKSTFQCDVQKVWDIVMAFNTCSWRSDLSKIEIINKNQFVEYTKTGYATMFTITVVEPFKRLEFDMENTNIKGHWIGLFSQKDRETTIDFTEHVVVKNFLLRPFGKLYLRKQQSQYVADLRKALG